MKAPGVALDLSLYLVLDPALCGGAANMVRTARLAALAPDDGIAL